MKRRFCTAKFLKLVEKAKALMLLTSGNEVTFSKTGASVYSNYGKGKIFANHEQYTAEEKEAYRMNGDRIFTLTFAQVSNCFWEAK